MSAKISVILGCLSVCVLVAGVGWATLMLWDAADSEPHKSPLTDQQKKQALQVREPIQKQWLALHDRTASRLKGGLSKQEVEEYRQVAEAAHKAYLADGLGIDFALAAQRNLIRVTHYNVGRDEARAEVIKLGAIDATDWPVDKWLQACLVDLNTDFWRDPSQKLSQWQHDDYEWLARQTGGRSGFATDVRFEYSRVLFVSGQRREAIAQLRKILEASPDLCNMNGTLMLACKYDALADASFKEVFEKAGGSPSRVAGYADYVRDRQLGPQWSNADRDLPVFDDHNRL